MSTGLACQHAPEFKQEPAPGISYLDIKRIVKSPYVFSIFVALLGYFCVWPKAWLLSTAPFLHFILLVGDARRSRVLPDFSLYPVITTLHLAYAICSTSWLLYDTFTVVCAICIFLVSLYQFEIVADNVRRVLRGVLVRMHFIGNKIAFFQIPALEIDTDVEGLMVVRGVTFIVSQLTFVVHGVEVGIKVADDIELAIQCPEVTIRLFRDILIGDCYMNAKGGGEMTFGSDGRDDDVERGGEQMIDNMTDGKGTENSSPKEGLEGMRKMRFDNDEAIERYQSTLDDIHTTSTIFEAEQTVKRRNKRNGEDKSFDNSEKQPVRAAICSLLHSKPSIAHPPTKSIKVSAIKNSSPPYVKRFLHRLPMLLRLLLNPLSYFHPVHIASVTATASGQWINSLILDKLFPPSDGVSSNELDSLKSDISNYLSEANFALQLTDLTGIAQVPFIPSYPIKCLVASEEILTYRSLAAEVQLSQVFRLGGADAHFVLPSFLLPHHEHLVPPPPQPNFEPIQEEISDILENEKKNEQNEEDIHRPKDEASIDIAIHILLPALFSQALLDFTAALVKATKITETENEQADLIEEYENHSHTKMEQLGQKIKVGVKGVARRGAGGIVNEKWIARIVGKVMRKLEGAKGSVGYAFELKKGLEAYRNEGWREDEGEKILP